MSATKKRFTAAIDQGTTSTRCILFDREGVPRFSSQMEHQQYYPKPGWVEHDADEIWKRTCSVVRDVLDQAGCTAEDLAAVGITNQRETVIPWSRSSGAPLCRGIVWQDMRGSRQIESMISQGGIDQLRDVTGLPLSPYFAASKMQWLIENVPSVQQAAEDGDLCLGTVDAWLIWKLTGGQQYVTDVTNASRYLMMDIQSLQWDRDLVSLFHLDTDYLPEIVPSMGQVIGLTSKEGPFGGEVPICGVLGDQQAALFGQACIEVGQGKNTYGTGCFLLVNTGTRLPVSAQGLLTTPAYQIAGSAPVYALEGSIAVAGSLVQWFRDNIGLITKAPEINDLASQVEDNGGVYFVPAFSGLYAPYWDSSARGMIAGITAYVRSGHLARAVLEATAYQTKDIVDAMEKDSGVPIRELRADGGMSQSEILMQYQADILQVPVVRPVVNETTALGAAYAAGLTQGFWNGLEDMVLHWQEDRRWMPAMDPAIRDREMRRWHRAVERSKSWETEDDL